MYLVKMRPYCSRSVPLQCDWCPYKKGDCDSNTHRQKARGGLECAASSPGPTRSRAGLEHTLPSRLLREALNLGPPGSKTVDSQCPGRGGGGGGTQGRVFIRTILANSQKRWTHLPLQSENARCSLSQPCRGLGKDSWPGLCWREAPAQLAKRGQGLRHPVRQHTAAVAATSRSPTGRWQLQLERPAGPRSPSRDSHTWEQGHQVSAGRALQPG